MIAAVLVVIAAALIVAATFFWLGRRDTVADGAPELIRAPSRPYKVKPDNPGGLDIAGDSRTAFETSAGEDHDAQLDLGRSPEIAAQAPPAQVEPAPSQPAAAKPAVPAAAPVAVPPPTGPGGSVIQLGAFKNQAQAERAWTALSTRFPAIAALNKRIVPFSGGIRLRASAASPAAAKAACQALEAAGENCFVAR